LRKSRNWQHETLQAVGGEKTIKLRLFAECETISRSPKPLSFTNPKGGIVEKHLATAAYWIAIACTAIALVARGLAVVGIFALRTTYAGKGNPVSYRTFLEGATLFFVMAIASAVIAWAKERKA